MQFTADDRIVPNVILNERAVAFNYRERVASEQEKNVFVNMIQTKRLQENERQFKDKIP